MTRIEPGDQFVVCDEMGYRITAGPVPVPLKGGPPERLEILSIEEGLVSVREEWTSGGSQTRQMYTENIETLLKHDDIRREGAENRQSNDEDTGMASETTSSNESSATRETTNTVDRAAETVDNDESAEDGENAETPSEQACSVQESGDTAREQWRHDEDDDVAFIDSEPPAAEQTAEDEPENESESQDGGDGGFLIGS